jgi:N utilization substance protein B
MLRIESKVRARALQILYAWESGGAINPVGDVARRAISMSNGSAKELERAQELAQSVADRFEEYDLEIAEAADNWRLERVGLIEKIVLRIGLFELKNTDTPGPVIIDEALRLAHWFGGVKAPKFVNGVLDRLARSNNRL